MKKINIWLDKKFHRYADFCFVEVKERKNFKCFIFMIKFLGDEFEGKIYLYACENLGKLFKQKNLKSLDDLNFFLKIILRSRNQPMIFKCSFRLIFVINQVKTLKIELRRPREEA